MSNSMYDKLKTAALIATPVTVLITTVCTAWGVPNLEPIAATLAAIDVFLGALVTALKTSYDKEGK